MKLLIRERRYDLKLQIKIRGEFWIQKRRRENEILAKIVSKLGKIYKAKICYRI
jgi:hypothetical protein